jgi:hypothetical protein
MADGQVVFEISGDSSGINKTVKQVTNEIDRESKKWDNSVDKSTGDMKNSFTKMLGNISAAMIAAKIGEKILEWGQAAIDAASDLAEVQNVVDTVFGDASSTIDKWAKNAGEKFGLTETQAKKFTSTLGAMMKSSGLAGNEIVGMSTDLAGLAADMASFYNLDFETAFEKIRSGISGETMPLKQLGINMSVANLEAFALAQGLEKTFAEMDQGEQTMLRYQYIMQATSDAQGDFSKTADGFANAQRRIESSLDSIKTSVGTLLIEPFSQATAAVADFLAQVAADMMPKKTVVDEFNEITIDTENKLAELQKTYETANSILNIIDDIEKKTVTLNDGSTISFGDLFRDLGKIENGGGDVQAYIQSLGLDVEEITFQYNKWKEATRQLTSTVPGLTSMIDSETGSINQSTDAVRNYLDTWLEGQKQLAYLQEHEKKGAALEAAFADLPGLELDKDLAAWRMKKAFDQVRDIYAKYKKNLAFDKNGNVDITGFYGITDEDQKALEEFKKSVEDTGLAKAYREASDAYEERKKAYDEAKQMYEEEGEMIADMADNIEEADDATEEWDEDLIKAGKDAVNATDSALKSLADYIQGVKDSTAQAVNSIIKGFDKIESAGAGLREKSNELAGEEAEALNKYSDVWAKFGSDNESLKKMAANWDNLSDTEKEAYEALVKIRNAQKETNDALDQYKPKGMQERLQSQIDFMTNYMENLRKAQEMGLSAEFLASLSDGSQESAEYLAGLVEAGPEAAQAVDALYQEVQSQKKSFTDALADQKLAADETYQGLVDAALQAISDMHLGDEAEAAMADTVEGLAQGIQDHVGDVQTAVDSIVAQLDRLSGWGLSFNIAGFNIEFGNFLDGSNEKGLDYVPFDGYLSELHEGEGILTAEENRIWQRFKNGDASSRNVDYETLGNVMRDNVHAGGNVYLDGRTVGHVISDAQGRSYRNLQRSGWQG